MAVLVVFAKVMVSILDDLLAEIDEEAERRSTTCWGICGPPLTMGEDWPRDAAQIAAEHELSFYDAAWGASANALGIALVSADRQLVSAGLAEEATGRGDRLLRKLVTEILMWLT